MWGLPHRRAWVIFLFWEVEYVLLQLQSHLVLTADSEFAWSCLALFYFDRFFKQRKEIAFNCFITGVEHCHDYFPAPVDGVCFEQHFKWHIQFPSRLTVYKSKSRVREIRRWCFPPPFCWFEVNRKNTSRRLVSLSLFMWLCQMMIDEINQSVRRIICCDKNLAFQENIARTYDLQITTRFSNHFSRS